MNQKPASGAGGRHGQADGDTERRGMMATTYEPLAGEHVGETAQRMVALATETGGTVTAHFNDRLLTANPGDDADGIVAYYQAEMDRAAEEYRASPLYAPDRERERREQERRDAALVRALASSPEHMTIRDPEGWQKSLSANQDPYGQAIHAYAERWARIMEGRMQGGAALADIADETASIADNEGITGFMHGAAAVILGHVWEHGDALRQWRGKGE